MKKLSHLLLFIIISTQLTAQSRGVKFYNPQDSIRYDELTLMLFNGYKVVSTKDGLKMQVVDSSLLKHNYSRDSLNKLRNNIPTYSFLTYNSNPSYTTLTQLHASDKKDTIQYLSFEGPSIDKLPIREILKCKKLKGLELVNTTVKKIPWLLNWSLFGLDSLQTIHIYNHQSKKALKFTKNDQVTKLVYRENPYAKAPKGLWKLKNLRELDLVRNDLRDAAVLKLNKFKKLKELNMSRNKIRIQDLTNSQIDNLENLILSFCDLDGIPATIKHFPSLKELQLAENDIKSENISSEMANLKELEILSFYKNNLTFLPAFLFELNQLEELDLYYNEIEIVPKEIGQLKQLERLYLANNRLFNIPDEIGQLTMLKELYLKHNRISYLPNTLCKLENITDFHVNDNYLQGFPDCILAFKKLRDLDISNNEIHSIPPELLDLHDLKLLWMRGITFEARNREEAESIRNTIEGLQKKGVKVSLDLE
ncbi:hypothetical protein GCM10027429_25710 [Marivirga atlantica]|jgi:Leucine-rich repeat (LRR) protein|uniref:Leucine-rich repeat domain-containing protein n=1 Tax=Marivirga atlantica TaxID=1548457 RepID=A0A937AG75_9BACT|nr:leucine-rich repeat domain-containing protein [Marivirga atlantica]MBL0766171.1 leucine-rich repeat domain-containing protein [Marivirga atlantica]